jgi:hypothetical protein
MVFNSGVYETRDLEDETIKRYFQVGTAKVSGSAQETEIHFHEEFNEPPMVISSVQTFNTGSMVQTRQLVAPADGKSFLVALEGPDGGIGSVKDEWIAWIAMEKGSGKIGAIEYEAIETGDEVGDGGHEVSYETKTLRLSPICLAASQRTTAQKQRILQLWKATSAARRQRLAQLTITSKVAMLTKKHQFSS